MDNTESAAGGNHIAQPMQRRRELEAQLSTESSTDRVVKVYRPSPMILPRDCGLVRVPPRNPTDRQDDYLAKYDSTTVFYDAFRADGDIWLSGPPLRNVLKPIRSASWRLDGIPIDSARLELRDWGRTQRSYIVGLGATGNGQNLSIELGDTELNGFVSSDDADLFDGRRVIVTKSKDNDLVWIQDFLRYYHLVHGVTGIVIYDNNSSRYSSEDVAAAIAAVDGIEAAVVVAWHLPWGPNGGPNGVWDSDYSQYSMLEHARFRYLRRAAGVVNADIDELALTDDGRSVFEHAADSPTGTIRYHGLWIAKATERSMDPQRQRRFIDYRHQARGKTTPKWTTIPGRTDPAATQWRIHSIPGAKSTLTEAVQHRHYQGVNNSWKYERPERTVDPARHVFDARMSDVLDVVFGRESVE